MKRMIACLLMLLAAGVPGCAGGPSCADVCARGRARGCPRCTSSCEQTCESYPWTEQVRAAMYNATTCRFGVGGGSDTFAVCDTPR